MLVIFVQHLIKVRLHVLALQEMSLMIGDTAVQSMIHSSGNLASSVTVFYCIQNYSLNNKRLRHERKLLLLSKVLEQRVRSIVTLLAVHGGDPTQSQAVTTLWEAGRGGIVYLLRALSISITTSTDKAIVIGSGAWKTLQSIPVKFSGSPKHCI